MCSDSGASEVEGCVRPTVIIMSNSPTFFEENELQDLPCCRGVN